MESIVCYCHFIVQHHHFIAVHCCLSIYHFVLFVYYFFHFLFIRNSVSEWKNRCTSTGQIGLDKRVVVSLIWLGKSTNTSFACESNTFFLPIHFLYLPFALCQWSILCGHFDVIRFGCDANATLWLNAIYKSCRLFGEMLIFVLFYQSAAQKKKRELFSLWNAQRMIYDYWCFRLNRQYNGPL